MLIINKDLKENLIELKKDKEVFHKYIKAFYDIEKVKETFKGEEEFKIIEEYIKKEDDNN